MNIDMELVYGNEDYEELQEYFEHRKYDYPSGLQNISDRLKYEYIPDTLEEENEEDKISDRREAIRRIFARMEEIPSDCQKPSVSETECKGQK